jgi:aryl-alcohol dehydrogenase-like predicted oxidoreductase
MEFGSRIDEKTSFALLEEYVDAGGVWIDAANCYAFWQHESGHVDRARNCSADGSRSGRGFVTG